MLTQGSKSWANFFVSNAVESQECDHLVTLIANSVEQQERLGQLEALLRLMESAMGDDEDRYAIRLAIDVANQAYNFHDMKIDMSIRNLK